MKRDEVRERRRRKQLSKGRHVEMEEMDAIGGDTKCNDPVAEFDFDLSKATRRLVHASYENNIRKTDGHHVARG
eukprot:746143-Hanusia_phi.AAC.3